MPCVHVMSIHISSPQVSHESRDAIPAMLAACVLAEGWGVDKDLPAALHWLHHAHERGNVEAGEVIAQLTLL